MVVKNTFLDLSGTPGIPQLARGRSAPDAKIGAQESEGDASPAESGGVSELPSTPMALCRAETPQWWEWSEAQGFAEAAQRGYLAAPAMAEMGPQPECLPAQVEAPAATCSAGQLACCPAKVRECCQWLQAGGPAAGSCLSAPLMMQMECLPPRPAASASQPQTLKTSCESGAARVSWTVDARKLASNDTHAVSPSFDLDFGAGLLGCHFKITLCPRVMGRSKGQASFRRAEGRGFVQLRALGDDAPRLSFRVSVGASAPRGPVAHNFSLNTVCGLPKELEEWDLQSAVDKSTNTFAVSLELVPLPEAEA